jgi:hypothetical protein
MRKCYYEIAPPIRPGFASASRIWREKPVGNVAAEFTKALASGDILGGVLGEQFVDPASWDSPPHAALANLNYPALATEQQIAKFMKTYGVMRFMKTQGAAAEFVQMEEGTELFLTSITAFRFAQEQLRRTWRRPTSENLKSLWLPEALREFSAINIPLVWVQRQRSLGLRLADVWTYIRLLLARDADDGLTRFCANENCRHPFFVADRKDQQLCSKKCRDARNQRKFQEERRRKS